jgi:hypothetical protein
LGIRRVRSTSLRRFAFDATLNAIVSVTTKHLSPCQELHATQFGVLGLITLAEITMKNRKANGEIDLKDFLARVDFMVACGMRYDLFDF